MLAANRTTFPIRGWKQPEPGAKKALLLSLAAHSLLVLMFTVGLNWRTSSTPAGVEVELWDAPVPTRQIEPEPVVEKPVINNDEKAEIVTKKKKEEPKPEKPKVEKKPTTPPLTFKPIEKPKPKPEPPKVEPPKVKESPKAKPTTDPIKEAKEARAKADAEKDRLDRIEKLRAQAGSEGGGSGGMVGSGVGTGGNDSPGFAEKVIKFIKPKITFNPAGVVGNPAVTIQVDLAPDGRIIKQKLVKSSGLSEWDNAILRTLELAGSLPKDDNGSVPRQITLIFRPKD